MHWYVLSTVTGVVTLCASEADARREAEAFDRLYPNAAPHIATRLVPVEAADKIELLQARLDVAITTLRQIGETPRNKGARRNALATVRFLDTQQLTQG